MLSQLRPLFTFAMTAATVPLSRGLSIISECACGGLRVRVPVAAVTTSTTSITEEDEGKASSRVVVDCHCPKCRKFHVAGLVSYLVVPKDQVSIIAGTPPKYYRDQCDELGIVDRMQCGKCASKIMTRPVDSDVDSPSYYINMGALVDASIPPELAQNWTSPRQRKQRGVAWKPVWTAANPAYSVGATMGPVRKILRGGCTCGASRYEINCTIPTELQHCYCHLCRQYSGGTYMTWMPLTELEFRWTSSPAPPLVRTTPHAQRHFCADCGGALTLIYDEQPRVIWPAVGGMDDDSLPSDTNEMNGMLKRVLHICCRSQPSWYELPNDGLPRMNWYELPKDGIP
jgi:hypothetical protein